MRKISEGPRKNHDV